MKAEAATTGSRSGFSGHERFSSKHCTSGSSAQSHVNSSGRERAC